MKIPDISYSRTPFLLTAALILLLATPRLAPAWGEHGHTISGRAAATNLPTDMPAFFRAASALLSLDNESSDDVARDASTITELLQK